MSEFWYMGEDPHWYMGEDPHCFTYYCYLVEKVRNMETNVSTNTVKSWRVFSKILFLERREIILFQDAFPIKKEGIIFQNVTPAKNGENYNPKCYS